jgi:hypothetical protein
MGDEHRGGLLDVVATCMEEGIEGELGTTGEVETLGAPGNFDLWSEECGVRSEITLRC